MDKLSLQSLHSDGKQFNKEYQNENIIVCLTPWKIDDDKVRLSP